jgi:hypothetical protein
MAVLADQGERREMEQLQRQHKSEVLFLNLRQRCQFLLPVMSCGPVTVEYLELAMSQEKSVTDLESPSRHYPPPPPHLNHPGHQFQHLLW